MRIPLADVKSESKKIKNQTKELLTSMTPSSPATAEARSFKYLISLPQLLVDSTLAYTILSKEI